MINLAVIGYGRWGPNHVRVFNSLPNSRVIAVAEAEAGRREQLSQAMPGLQIEQHYQPILNNPDIQAIVIATPTATHYQLVKEALLAGKHVLCEKPLTETTAQAQELVNLAQTQNRQLMVGNIFLFNSGIIKVKELIASGDLGELYYLSAVRTNLGPIRGDVNASYDLATHDIAIFNWLLDSQPEQVSAVGGVFLQPGVEDVVFISLKYPGNVVANIHASWLNPKKVRQITVIGTKKMVTWDDLDLSAPVAIYEKGANVTPTYGDYGEFLRVSMWDGEIRMPRVNLEEPMKMQANFFLAALQKGQVERSDALFSLGVVKVLEAVNASLRLNGQPILIA